MKKILSLIFLLLLVPVLAKASITEAYATWTEEPNQVSQNQIDSIMLNRGDQANFYFSAASGTDTLGYRVMITENREMIVPHTVIQNNTFSAFQSFDTSNLEEGTYRLEVSANDNGVEGTYQDTYFLYLTIQDLNHAPTLSNPTPSNAANNIPLNQILSWQANDEDGDELIYQVFLSKDETFTLPERITTNLRVSEIAPTNLEPNTKYYWKVYATDTKATIEGPTWTFTTKQITQENHAPVIQEIPNKRTRCNRDFTLQVIATDEDSDKLTYSDNTNLFDINKETGLISFKPSCEDAGKHEITITVVDEHRAIAQDTFILDIYKASSGGGSSSSGSYVGTEVETEVLTKEGICRADGYRTIIYKTIDKDTGEILDIKTSDETCDLYEPTEQETYEYTNNAAIVWIVALIFLLITIPIAGYLYKKLAQ